MKQCPRRHPRRSRRYSRKPGADAPCGRRSTLPARAMCLPSTRRRVSARLHQDGWTDPESNVRVRKVGDRKTVRIFSSEPARSSARISSATPAPGLGGWATGPALLQRTWRKLARRRSPPTKVAAYESWPGRKIKCIPLTAGILRCRPATRQKSGLPTIVSGSTANVHLPARRPRSCVKATAEGSVPGVVAGATNRRAILYLGGFGEGACLGGGDEMTPGHRAVGWRPMTKALTGAGCHATCRRRGQLDLDLPASGESVSRPGSTPVSSRASEEDGAPPHAPPPQRATSHCVTSLISHRRISYETSRTHRFTSPSQERHRVQRPLHQALPGIISCLDAGRSGPPLLFDPARPLGIRHQHRTGSARWYEKPCRASASESISRRSTFSSRLAWKDNRLSPFKPNAMKRARS